MPLPFKLPLDAYVLMVPTAYATAALFTMCTRVLTSDPETSTLKYYDNESECAAAAQRHDSTFKQYFSARIRAHRTGVFQNWFDGSRQ